MSFKYKVWLNDADYVIAEGLLAHVSDGDLIITGKRFHDAEGNTQVMTECFASHSWTRWKVME